MTTAATSVPVPRHQVLGFCSDADRARRPDRLEACPCGYGWLDRDRSHGPQHLAWSLGVPVPEPLDWPQELPIAVVSQAAPAAWQNLAHRCAVVAARAQGHDASSFPRYHRPRGGWLPREQVPVRAYLYRIDRSVVGCLTSMPDPVVGWIDAATDTITQLPATAPHPVRPSIGVIFVAQRWRRRGVATALVHALAEDHGIAVEDLPWYTPLSAEGRATARAICAASGRAWLA
jgi:GNAT superfamily N-acetyltransferase